ncbi:MAG TPA: zinc-dependent metalloprotease family protein [Flavobacterium sp.]
MMKKLLISMMALVFFASGYGQSSLWKTASNEKLAATPKMERTSIPTQYELFSLDYAALKSQLEIAPSRDNGQVSNVIIAFPGADGQFQNFRIYEASVMHPDLAARYSDIKSYVGQGVEDPTTSIYLSTTIFGLHTMTLSSKGASYIDTYTKDLSNYIVYSKANVLPGRTFECHVVEEPVEEVGGRSNNNTSLASDGIFRTYRLAMASTSEYSAFHVNAAGLNAGTTAQKKAAVLAAMNVTMTRVNGVYERDMSLRMQLVPNNDLIIFIGFDSFNNNDAGTLINQSQTVIDANIGPANYDIGHTVSTGGGGLAQLNSPCTANKARGITGSPSPVGDPYDIDYVAHEMGHQFGGTHTFNNSCDGNVAGATSVEPGSGTTIMAYAGICAPDIQGNSDPYFHAVSIAQMSAFVAGTGSCSVNVPNNNAAPVVNAGADFIIPNGTPFILKGSATDANGDVLTYSWEQTNIEQTTQPPLSTSTTGPSFKSQIPSPSPNRFMPSLQNILAGMLTSGGFEVLPTVARTMNFALTVRDNRTPNGGQTGRDNKVITFANVGPFVVTSQNTDQLVLAPGSTQTVTWNVAGTTANGINTANVNILLSTDGGYTWSTVLAANTPNDGSQEITIPSISQPNCRIIVEAVGNIFFSINGKNIAIGNYQYSQQNVCTDYTFNAGVPVPESATSYSGFNVNVTDSYVLSDVNIRPVFTHPNVGSLYFAVRSPMTAAPAITRLKSAGCAGSANLNLLYDSQGTAVNCAATTSGAPTLPQDPLTALNGQMSNGTWTFFIVDIAVGDGVTGTWDSLTLNLCRSEFVPMLKTAAVGLEGFSLYPNPNNGSFNVKFNSYSSNKINISVHDIQGRKIFEQGYDNTGLFNESLQLNKVQAGVYLVTVQDGAAKEVKRIVVQ